jgi:ketosteroid isomerase-like protein
MSDEDYIRDLNEAVARHDIELFTSRMNPDVVWEHNPGTGSPEEGVYEGRDEVGQLFERVLEGWEYMRPVATDITEDEPGVYQVHGELHCKHGATQNEIVERYVQRAQIRDGRLARMWMVVGTDG